MGAMACTTSSSITSKPRAEEGDVGGILKKIKNEEKKKEGSEEKRDQSSRKLKRTTHEATVISGERSVPFKTLSDELTSGKSGWRGLLLLLYVCIGVTEKAELL